MGEPKFTSGEWRVDLRCSTRVTNEQDRTICSAGGHNEPGSDNARTENEANAHLLSMAKKMYEMLDTLRDCLAHENFDMVDDIEALLAKARGEEA